MRLYAKISAAACLMACAAVCRPSTAQADIDWQLLGVNLDNAATVTGTFVTSDAGYLQSADLTVSAFGTNPAQVFDSTSSSIFLNSFNYQLNMETKNTVELDPGITITFDNVLTASANPDYITISDTLSQFRENPYDYYYIKTGEACIVGTCGGTQTSPVPEPMSLVLLGTGLVGLVFLRSRYGKLRPA